MKKLHKSTETSYPGRNKLRLHRQTLHVLQSHQLPRIVAGNYEVKPTEWLTCQSSEND